MSKTEPELFREKPAKMLADPTYASPRITAKSRWLTDLEDRQAGLPKAGVIPLHSSRK